MVMTYFLHFPENSQAHGRVNPPPSCIKIVIHLNS
jgi:hypothetical protein